MSTQPKKPVFDFRAPDVPQQYDSLENIMSRKRILALLKSKAVWGTIGGAIVWASQQPVLDLPTILQAGSAIIAAGGFRDAIEKIKLGVK